jgi:hypothetical protein
MTRLAGAALVTLVLIDPCKAQLPKAQSGQPSAEELSRIEEHRRSLGLNPRETTKQIPPGFPGRWCIKTPDGKPSSYVTILASGEAKKTSDPNGTGKWEPIKDGKGKEVGIRITWSDGWKTTIEQKEKGTWKRGSVTVGHTPGTDWSDAPTNSYQIVKVPDAAPPGGGGSGGLPRLYPASLKLGAKLPAQVDGKIIQVIDKDRMLVEISDIVTPELSKTLIMVKGSTEGRVDGQFGRDIASGMTITGTTAYKTALGGTKTVFVVEPKK